MWRTLRDSSSFLTQWKPPGGGGDGKVTARLWEWSWNRTVQDPGEEEKGGHRKENGHQDMRCSCWASPLCLYTVGRRDVNNVPIRFFSLFLYVEKKQFFLSFSWVVWYFGPLSYLTVESRCRFYFLPVLPYAGHRWSPERGVDSRGWKNSYRAGAKVLRAVGKGVGRKITFL